VLIVRFAECCLDQVITGRIGVSACFHLTAFTLVDFTSLQISLNISTVAAGHTGSVLFQVSQCLLPASCLEHQSLIELVCFERPAPAIVKSAHFKFKSITGTPVHIVEHVKTVLQQLDTLVIEEDIALDTAHFECQGIQTIKGENLRVIRKLLESLETLVTASRTNKDQAWNQVTRLYKS
jgi:hypothetical protein